MADTHHHSAEFRGTLLGIGINFFFVCPVECDRWKLDYTGLCHNNVSNNVRMELWKQSQV